MPSDPAGIWKAYIEACAAAANLAFYEVGSAEVQEQIRRGAAARIAAGLASEADRNVFAFWHRYQELVAQG